MGLDFRWEDFLQSRPIVERFSPGPSCSAREEGALALVQTVLVFLSRPFLILRSFDVTEAQAGPRAGLSEHLSLSLP